MSQETQRVIREHRDGAFGNDIEMIDGTGVVGGDDSVDVSQWVDEDEDDMPVDQATYMHALRSASQLYR